MEERVSDLPEAGGGPLREQGEPPAVPRPAATVILLRRGGKHAQRGLELLLVQRNPAARFMPGVWVFPGGAVDPADGDGEAAHRAAAVRELAEEAGIRVDADDLVAYSRWITPRVVPVRFDTRFYLALAPAHSPPKPDGSETVDAGWFEPQKALDLHHADQLPLVFPTIKHLESLTGFASAEEALETARRREVKPVEPEVVGEGDERRIVLPDELL
jgi:8-oxo-dGTP pyrophosphatase MutT (NUDIX family)